MFYGLLASVTDFFVFFLFKQKTAYERRISDWSSDVCSSDLPSFSRATLIGDGANARLLVSGTASVVGHESLHAGDLTAQLDETMANLDAQIGRASCRERVCQYV